MPSYTPLSQCPDLYDDDIAVPFPTAGGILEREYMEPLGLSRNALAKALGVPVMRISDIVAGKRGITPDTAVRLGRYFRTSAQFWLNLQNQSDLRKAEAAVPDIAPCPLLDPAPAPKAKPQRAATPRQAKKTTTRSSGKGMRRISQ